MTSLRAIEHLCYNQLQPYSATCLGGWLSYGVHVRNIYPDDDSHQASKDRERTTRALDAIYQRAPVLSAVCFVSWVVTSNPVLQRHRAPV